MIATYPVGGVAWDYGQYALGLERLGFDVYYLEDTGLPSYTQNPVTGKYLEDCSHGVQFLQESLALLSPTLGERWHFHAFDGSRHGLGSAEIADVIARADLFLNVSGSCLLRDEYRRCPRKVFIDTDPGWNHFVIFPRWDSKPEAERSLGFRGHDYFFTYAQRLMKEDCPLTPFGLTWHPTRPPVVLDCWLPQPPGDKWTTVMMWNNYQKPIEHNGVEYGSKEREFGRFESIPSRVNASFEAGIYAVGESLPTEHWRSLGWSVVDGRENSKTADLYRTYIERSRGEFSVAKNIYVATNSGWFSCRSVCYLAAGRPVVVQDTGFSETVPTGEGLLAFSTLEEAIAAVESVENDYARHERAARAIASAEFDADRVLGDLLNTIGLV